MIYLKHFSHYLPSFPPTYPFTCSLLILVVLVTTSMPFTVRAAASSPVPLQLAAPQIMTTTSVQTVETVPDDVADELIQEILPPTTPAPRPPLRVHATTLTFYNSDIGQTDRTPTITASGRDVFDGLVATNIYPFGTKLRFPDLFGDKVFEVQDRMNPRYSNRMDVWLESKREAIRLGIKRNVKVEILQMGNGEKYWAQRTKLSQLSKKNRAS